MIRSAIFAVAVQLAAGAAWAQNDPSSEFTVAARIAVESHWCSRLGFSVDSKQFDALADKVLTQAARAGMDPKAADAALVKVVDKETAESRLWHEQASQRADEGHLEAYAVEVYDYHLARCNALAATPLGATILGRPSAAASVLARREMVDDNIELAGQASWQTRPIVARGVRLQAAGMCDAHLSDAARIRLIAGLAEAALSPDPVTARVARYSLNMFDAGKVGAKQAGFTQAQCDQVMARQDAAVEAADRG